MKPSGASSGVLLQLTWHAVAVVLVMLAPALLWLGRPLWALSSTQLPQVVLAGTAYLGLALFVSLASARPSGIGVFAVLAAALVCFGASFGLVAFRPDIPSSRAMMLLSAALGVVLAILPYVDGRARRWAFLSTGVLLPLAAFAIARRPPKDLPQTRLLHSSSYRVTLSYFHDLVGRPLQMDGGAIARFGSGFLLVTGAGDFYRLDWNAKGDSLRSVALALAAPLDRAGYLASLSDRSAAQRLRVTGLLLDTTVTPVKVFVAHQHWNQAQKCFTMRVSSTIVDESPRRSGASPGTWESIFETQPCLSTVASFDDAESGGRLAWGAGKQLLMTVGDHGFDGRAGAAFAQLKDNDYGKVLLLDQKGGRQIVSMGNRNPQGLTVDREGRVWEAEHGPAGGDELNVIVKGGNYGWPFATYGSEYGLDRWTQAGEARDHRGFVEPAHVWLPSSAISSVIQLGSRQFPRWDGDLLVGSLGGHTFFHVRTRGDRVTYVEPMLADRRIRDLAEGSDGRVVAWTDEGDVLSLARTDWEARGLDVYVRCQACHEIGPGGTGASAPSLRGIVGRPVASQADFAYSDALRSLGGNWTKERLDAFLKDPRAYAPGSRMGPGAVPNPLERSAVIEYMETRK